MNNASDPEQDFHWKCHQCQCCLQIGPVTVGYLGNHFATELPKCPECGLVFVSESVALGKMAQVEQMLEDK